MFATGLQWWLKVAGFWNYPKAPAVPVLEAAGGALSPPSWGLLLLTNGAVALAAAYAGVRYGRKGGGRHGYTAILDKAPVPVQTPFHVQIEL